MPMINFRFPTQRMGARIPIGKGRTRHSQYKNFFINPLSPQAISPYPRDQPVAHFLRIVLVAIQGFLQEVILQARTDDD